MLQRHGWKVENALVPPELLELSLDPTFILEEGVTHVGQGDFGVVAEQSDEQSANLVASLVDAVNETADDLGMDSCRVEVTFLARGAKQRDNLGEQSDVGWQVVGEGTNLLFEDAHTLQFHVDGHEKKLAGDLGGRVPSHDGSIAGHPGQSPALVSKFLLHRIPYRGGAAVAGEIETLCIGGDGWDDGPGSFGKGGDVDSWEIGVPDKGEELIDSRADGDSLGIEWIRMATRKDVGEGTGSFIDTLEQLKLGLRRAGGIVR